MNGPCLNVLWEEFAANPINLMPVVEKTKAAYHRQRFQPGGSKPGDEEGGRELESLSGKCDSGSS